MWNKRIQIPNQIHQIPKAQGLTEVTWVHQPLENLGNLKLGKFDFIECREVISSSKNHNMFMFQI